MKLRYFREKGFIKNYAVEIVESDIACFKKWYTNLCPKSSYTAVNTHADEGNQILFDVSHVLSWNVRPNSSNNNGFKVELVIF